jgi:hypothetical protein
MRIFLNELGSTLGCKTSARFYSLQLFLNPCSRNGARPYLCELFRALSQVLVTRDSMESFMTKNNRFYISSLTN